MDHCLQPYIDDFAVCYLDDVVIFSTNEKEHEDHVKKALQSLHQFGLYCKVEKWQFGASDIGILGFIIALTGSAWNQTAYQPSKTGLSPTQSELFKSF
jgi:hypothetical protein